MLAIAQQETPWITGQQACRKNAVTRYGTQIKKEKKDCWGPVYTSLSLSEKSNTKLPTLEGPAQLQNFHDVFIWLFRDSDDCWENDYLTGF